MLYQTYVLTQRYMAYTICTKMHLRAEICRGQFVRTTCVHALIRESALTYLYVPKMHREELLTRMVQREVPVTMSPIEFVCLMVRFFFPSLLLRRVLVFTCLLIHTCMNAVLALVRTVVSFKKK